MFVFPAYGSRVEASQNWQPLLYWDNQQSAIIIADNCSCVHNGKKYSHVEMLESVGVFSGVNAGMAFRAGADRIAFSLVADA